MSFTWLDCSVVLSCFFTGCHFSFYATTLHDDLPNSIMLVWYSDRFLIPIFALARSISNLDVCLSGFIFFLLLLSPKRSCWLD